MIYGFLSAESQLLQRNELSILAGMFGRSCCGVRTNILFCLTRSADRAGWTSLVMITIITITRRYLWSRQAGPPPRSGSFHLLLDDKTSNRPQSQAGPSRHLDREEGERKHVSSDQICFMNYLEKTFPKLIKLFAIIFPAPSATSDQRQENMRGMEIMYY